MTPYRDVELGAALRGLEVPEHRPEFDALLRERLAQERRRARVAPPRRRVQRLRIAALAAALAVAAAVAGVPLLDRATDLGGGPEPATAAEIQERIRVALAELESLSGVLVEDGPQAGDEARWRFTLTTRGDFRITGLTVDEDASYDAEAGLYRSSAVSESLGGEGPRFHSELRGVAPGPPDESPASWRLPRTFGAVVRAFLGEEELRVDEIEHDGRPAWRLALDAVPNAIVPDVSGDRLEIVVDRESGLPLRVLETRNGAFVRSLTLEDVAVDEPPAPSTFRLELPAGAEVDRRDVGFRRVALDEVERAVGYAPLVPAWVPEGYELAEVAVAREGSFTGTEAGNPRSLRVVSLSFRRGFDQFLVTTRLADVPNGSGLPVEERWSDPLATGEGFRDEPEPLELTEGALAGARAELLLAPRATPHVWAVTPELVVTVNGDLTRAELLRVTESLRRDG
ncbi:MAG TPA: hypothetical protein VFO88_07800 [Gaiellaceae bacterium]|nr:hypothetical protein [Gaiellaceae bacterium]